MLRPPATFSQLSGLDVTLNQQSKRGQDSTMQKPESKKKQAKKSTAAPESSRLNRRTFVKLVPALGFAVVASPHLSGTFATGQTPSASPSPTPLPSPSPTPLRVTKDMLRQAEKLIGIELTDAQEAMALPSANTNLERYETL